MAHYAFLDEDGVVIKVIPGRDEDDKPDNILSWEDYYSDVTGNICKRCSYNTRAGEHIAGGTPYRGNYPDIGDLYREDIDAFIKPQPYPSWTLNESTFVWDPPSPEPDSGGPYEWDEQEQYWKPMLDWV